MTAIAWPYGPATQEERDDVLDATQECAAGCGDPLGYDEARVRLGEGWGMQASQLAHATCVAACRCGSPARHLVRLDARHPARLATCDDCHPRLEAY